MKRILFLLLFVSGQAFASKLDNVFCNQSDVCKEYCELRENNTFDDNNPRHEEMLVECSQNLSSESDVMTDKVLRDVGDVDTTIRDLCPEYYNAVAQKKEYSNNLFLKCLEKLP